MPLPRELRFLEGEAALKARIRSLSGREPNAKTTAFVSACISHGRLFWQSAADAPLETSPLLLYYGATSFAKALIVASGLRGGFEAVAKSHGLSSTAGFSDAIGDFTTRPSGRGLFQQFNDMVAPRSRIDYLEWSVPHRQSMPTALSDQLPAFELPLKDILARMPYIASQYEMCTAGTSKSVELQLVSPFRAGDPWRISLNAKPSLSCVDRLKDFVQTIRTRVPMLAAWRFESAESGYGSTTVYFEAVSPVGEDLNRVQLDGPRGGEEYTVGGRTADEIGQQFSPFTHFAPLSGGSGDSLTAYIEPVQGVDVSEHSLALLGLFALGMLVRYRPHIWTAAVYRRRIGETLPDDGLIPVIEAFLLDSNVRFPKLVVDVLLGN